METFTGVKTMPKAKPSMKLSDWEIVCILEGLKNVNAEKDSLAALVNKIENAAVIRVTPQ